MTDQPNTSANAPVSTNAESGPGGESDLMREAFEGWFYSLFPSGSTRSTAFLLRRGPAIRNEYGGILTQIRWEGWQAACAWQAARRDDEARRLLLAEAESVLRGLSLIVAKQTDFPTVGKAWRKDALDLADRIAAALAKE